MTADAKDKAQVKRYDLVTDREGNVSLEEIANGSYVEFDSIAHLLQAQPTEAGEFDMDAAYTQLALIQLEWPEVTETGRAMVLARWQFNQLKAKEGQDS